ncbi:MAG: quercetin dioxygenase-like cupin family protein [Parasphingorhabdus sp.]|jgi:quercetin dioxygenase-like cupin family protein
MTIFSKSLILCGLVFTPFINTVAGELKLENLMTEELQGASGIEVIVSRVSIPPDTSLPKHWHPGEEFAYILKGSVTLWQKGKKSIFMKEGDTAKVPFKQIHTAITGDEGVSLLVFRVHEKGKPERVKAE